MELIIYSVRCIDENGNQKVESVLAFTRQEAQKILTARTKAAKRRQILVNLQRKVLFGFRLF